MSTQISYRKGTASQNNAFTGALAEITVDTTNKTLRVHDGATQGGSNIATVSYVDQSIASLSANSITDGTSSVVILTTNGNIRSNVGGSTVQLLSSGGANITGYITATGNITGGNLSIGGDAVISGNLSVQGTETIFNVQTLTVNDKDIVVANNVTGGANINGAGLLAGNPTVASWVFDNATTSWQSNIALTPIANGTLDLGKTENRWGNAWLAALTVTGNIAAAIVSVDSITKTGSNGVGNIGSSDSAFDTVHAKATSAQYADVAEKYLADRQYESGTVVEIGGIAEVTETTTFGSTRIAGVISTDPAFIMNSGANGQHVVAVALLGRVPCRVAGIIQRGDLLCSSAIAGHAARLPPDQYQPGMIIGKALADHDQNGPGMIEIMVGRL